jgi:hypothetical protein
MSVKAAAVVAADNRPAMNGGTKFGTGEGA